MKHQITTQQVEKIATLAKIPLTQPEAEKLASGFADTLDTIDDLKNIDVKDVNPTSQVTGLENAWREDIVDETRTFTQAEALSGAKLTHNGYFVVPRLIKKS